MADKKASFYFNNFTECTQISCEAARMLRRIVIDYKTAKLKENMQLLHNIENKADSLKHQLISELFSAFITPIERDDIIRLSQNIDDITDSIEDILIHIYTNNITKLRPDCVAFTDLLLKCCEATCDVMEEFINFKKSKKLKNLMIEINRLEEVGDDMYITALRNLHTDGSQAIEIIAWQSIYNCFEKCFDTCEHVADIVETIMIANS